MIALRFFGRTIVLAIALLAPTLSAEANNCTVVQKEAADKQLWLNARDKKAATAQHLPWGVPGAPANADHESLLIQRDYLTDYDADLRVPIWVAYQLQAKGLGKSGRINCFRTDPRLNADDASTRPDYDEPIFDQGHLANNGDMTRSATSVINSFILSNMTPQYCQFNEGVWQMLENIVRLWAKDASTLYVVTGSILDRNDDGQRDADGAALHMRSDNGDERVAIPTAFFKVVARKKNDTEIEVITLVMPNDQTDLNHQEAVDYIAAHVSKLAAVQRVTGLKLFPGFSGRIEEADVMWPFTGSPGHSLVGPRCRRTAGHLH